MVVFLIRTAIWLGSAALGIWVASLLLDDVNITWQGFLVAVIVFAVVQWIISPLVIKMALRYATAFVGGIGLVSTFVSLLVATLITDLSIDGVTTWVLATLIVWLVTALGTWLLPMIFLRNRVQQNRGSNVPGVG